MSSDKLCVMLKIGEQITSAKRWLERNSTPSRIIALVIFVAKVVPDALGREDFWSKHLRTIWRFISAHSTISVIVACTVLILTDNQRLARKRSTRYDERTLKGRTLKFCDDLEAFKKELGPEPEIKWTTGNSAQEFFDANEPMTIREQKMHHEFHLRFGERAWNLWHEHGAERRESEPLKQAMQGRLDCDERLNPVIDGFKQLAKMMDDD